MLINHRGDKRLGRTVMYAATIMVLALCVVSSGYAPKRGHAPAVPVDLIIVPDSEPWLLSIAAPLATTLKNADSAPILIAISIPPSEVAIAFVQRFEPRRCLFLTSTPEGSLIPGLEKIPTKIVPMNDGPTLAGLRLASEFWARSRQVVLASLDEPEAVILGSTLAAHLEVPFIPVVERGISKTLVEGLKSLGITRPIVAISDRRRRAIWADSLPCQAEVLDRTRLEQRLVECLGPANIRNVILCRVPDLQKNVGVTSWAAAYLSSHRKAPVIFTDSSNGEVAEARAEDFLKAHGLQPQTLTILSDQSSIGMITVTDPSWLGNYEVNVEPCSRPREGMASELGVGRIPCNTLMDASLLIANGLLRERVSGHQRPRALMVANPSSQNGLLPFAETISRLTAEEFKNHHMIVEEFYGTSSNAPEVLENAAEANLIVYEGHITDLRMFGSTAPPSYEYYETDEYGEHEEYQASGDDSGLLAEPSGCDEVPTPSFQDADVYVSKPEQDDPASPEVPVAEWQTAPISGEDRDYENSEQKDTWWQEQQAQESGERVTRLDGYPLVVLQSCHSMGNEIAKEIYDLGGIGVLGTVGNVYSASGSAFVKSFCDGMLYRDTTVGESLRDARNYFLCLADLKSKRGHTEQAKVIRAALSFAYWGDPELKLFSNRKPKRAPVTAAIHEPEVLRVSIPARKLSACRTEKYVAQMFPGSQAAGIVKKLKDRPYRKLMPVYYFMLPVPEDLEGFDFSTLARQGDTSERAAFLIDPFRRYLYVVYLPENEEPRNEFDLKFHKLNAVTDVAIEQGAGQ